ncbi:hypothetical protein EV207_101324 [Scopulibacillus darangshiensis]|uniref:Stage IV sporulation protein n=1 Tax=Scopulibacillus darangshiensis TaxID=442528 RepID=A0A4R2PEI2_9BACL|nr:sporulation protein YqfD [Scopulibacillus darangshiensis]TCP32345.1 hypothetical protein EV207_101324 [Scopulibacillus darangshiensis]
MKKNWNEAFFGHVNVTIKGRLPEQFINLCVKNGITIWDIKRIDDKSVSCSLLLSDIRKVKPVLKSTDCRIHFVDRKGFPFLLKRLLSRTGIIIGMVLFLAILFVLSNIVWRIDVTGADPKLESEIRKLLKKNDLHVGAFEFFLPSTEDIESYLSGKLTKVTWLGVSKDGTTYRVDVVQKELPKEDKQPGPRNLIASKKAVIYDIFVENGQAAVEPDQVVQPGQLLISGMIGNEKDPKFVGAKGKVIGETWYRSTTAVPLKSNYKTYTGNTYTKHQLRLFGWDMPLWGLEKKPYKTFDREVTVKPVHFLIWDLPIAYKRITYRQTEQANKKLTEEAAVKAGKEAAYKKLKGKLPDKAKIISRKVENKDVKDGVLTLKIFYIVHENIAVQNLISPEEQQEKIEKAKEKEKEKEEKSQDN